MGRMELEPIGVRVNLVEADAETYIVKDTGSQPKKLDANDQIDKLRSSGFAPIVVSTDKFLKYNPGLVNAELRETWLPIRPDRLGSIPKAEFHRVIKFTEHLASRGVTDKDFERTYAALNTWGSATATRRGKAEACLRRIFDLPEKASLSLKTDHQGSAISVFGDTGCLEGRIRLPGGPEQGFEFEANLFDGQFLTRTDSLATPPVKSIDGQAVKYDRDIVAGIVSMATPWRGSQIADQLPARILGLVLGGYAAARDLQPKIVEKFIAGHPIKAPRFGVAGTQATGGDLLKECLMGGLVLKGLGFLVGKPELRTNDGLVPIDSALPEGVTPVAAEKYKKNHYEIIRDDNIADRIIADIKKRYAGQDLVICLVNGLSGGHLAGPGVLSELVKEFGNGNVVILPTNAVNEKEFHDLRFTNGPQAGATIPVLGKRGLLSAGLCSLEDQSRFVAAKIRYMQENGMVKPGQKVLLVGHSMGGLASFGATYLLENGLQGFAD